MRLRCDVNQNKLSTKALRNFTRNYFKMATQAVIGGVYAF